MSVIGGGCDQWRAPVRKFSKRTGNIKVLLFFAGSFLFSPQTHQIVVIEFLLVLYQIVSG